MKAVTDTDGDRADELVSWIKENPDADPQQVYDSALKTGFGSRLNLVVQYGPQWYIAHRDMDELSTYTRLSFLTLNLIRDGSMALTTTSRWSTSTT